MLDLYYLEEDSPYCEELAPAINCIEKFLYQLTDTPWKEDPEEEISNDFEESAEITCNHLKEWILDMTNWESGATQ